MVPFVPFPSVSMPLALRSSAIDRLRLASILDGISYLTLLGIAMPLKYFADLPLAVRIVGSIHGFLFLSLCACLLEVLRKRRLSFGGCVTVFLCALLPFAPFFLDRKLKALGEKALGEKALGENALGENALGEVSHSAQNP